METEIVTLIVVCIVLFLTNLLFVWWSSGIMCKNLGFESRANCILVGIFLPVFYWPLFLFSFDVGLLNNSSKVLNERKKSKTEKKVKQKKK